MVPDFVSATAIIGTFIPIIFLICAVIVVLFAIKRKAQERELEHKERLLAIEKGQPLPMHPAKPENQKRKGRYPLAWPFVLMGFGLALILIYMIGELGDRHVDVEALGFGLAGLFIGVGLLLSRFYGVRKEENDLREEIAQENRYGVSEPDESVTFSSTESSSAESSETEVKKEE